MGPRVYNLFPTLAGPLDAWNAHFDRIAAMRFDWVYVNPITVTGGSGSLYAVADYYRLHPLVRGASTARDDDLVRAMVAAAGERGLRVMFDLVVNHTASDAPLVRERPAWYARDAAGNLRAPFATEDDGSKTVWGDLAEFDYSPRPERAELVAHVAGVVRHYARLGVAGFRCDAAFKVPADVWAQTMRAARDVAPLTVFAAETLGCTPDEVAALAPAGFDYLFNSLKWWDFHSPWLLQQYETFRGIAPSIAFPESHDTLRLAAELGARDDGELEAAYRFRYLVAAFFSTGVMMPMGYEFGFARKLDVVRTRPGDWETPRFDLQPFVAAVNAMKAAVPALNEEGPQRLAWHADTLALVRAAESTDDVAVAVLNPDPNQAAPFDERSLWRALAGTPRDITPAAPPDVTRAAPAHRDGAGVLGPLEVRIFARANGASERAAAAPPRDARAVVIANVTPQLDGGRYPVKRICGDTVTVEADVFREGHDALGAVLLHRAAGDDGWSESPLAPLGNDRYRGSFVVARNVRYEFTVEGWPDAFATWLHDAAIKRAAGQALALEAREGRALLAAARSRAETAGVAAVLERALRDVDAARSDDVRVAIMLDGEVASAAARAPERARATRYAPVLGVDVDRPAAQFAAWYELFPRSQGPRPGTHGTLAEAARRLPAIAAMGFDVAYLPPIHPIGRAFRKGPNNAPEAGPDDPGSPWAIGNADGGHMAIEPKLGTLADFDRFIIAARAAGVEVALDYALQCSPDHPYVREHPEWFAFRADGSLKYAENPPKKYQDIVNFDWYGAGAASLWHELREIVFFWIGHGVRIFRVDNPHTKPFAFWEWLIASVRERHPDTIFLAEAFTRPKVMAQLAKGGFAQSYTYFTWRTSKAELTSYVEELAHGAAADYFRPNFWPNTPDILPPFLQTGGRPAFRIRLALAATLASAYGIYSGFELCENAALPGREEYADSEKYQLRYRDYDAPGNLGPEIAAFNRIRREHPALHDWRNVTFYRADDDAVLFYGKRAGDDVVLVAVVLDPFSPRDPLLWVPTGELGIADDRDYDVDELLGGTRHRWRGSPQRWRLDPQINPAAVFHVKVPTP